MAQVERFPQPLPIDAAYALRVEGQTSTPAESARLRDMVIATQEVLEDHYSSYIHPKARERNVNLADRFVITHNLKEVQRGIEGLRKCTTRKLREGERIDGLSDTETGIIYIADPSEVWEASEKVQALYLQQFRDREKARLTHRADVLTKFPAHESIHQYQDWNISEAFGELSAAYIEHDVFATLQMARLEYPNDRPRALGYDRLLKRYGDIVHAISFGTLRNYPLQREIEREAKRIDEELVSRPSMKASFKIGMV